MQTNSTGPAIRVLRVDASGRPSTGSTTRALSDRLVQGMARKQALSITHRDVGHGLPCLDEAWIVANLTDPEQRSAGQKAILELSDTLIQEVVDADVLVIGVPLYNFGVPSTLKAWIDLIARARVTFRYTEQGPEGLLTGKTAYLVVATGGTQVDGAMDFATPWLRHVLGFLGIHDFHVVAAERQILQGEAALAKATAQIDALLGQDAPQAVVV